MKTDAAFFEIFKSNPARFKELTELALPRFKAARAPVLKTTLQATCDVLFEPARKDAPYWIAELQMYFDHSIFNRTDLARALVWLNALSPALVDWLGHRAARRSGRL